MQTQVISAKSSASLREFAETVRSTIYMPRIR